MNISVLCSSSEHPINSQLERWMEMHAASHQIQLLRNKRELPGGELLFLLSCTEILTAADRARYAHTLVLHASALPTGRGWSPHIWQIIAGATQLTVTLLEAADAVDSGPIWAQRTLMLPKHLLWDEINALLFNAEIELMEFAIRNHALIRASEQDPTVPPTYYRKRTPLDSQLDPARSIADQFDLMRVCDPARYPAFFDLHGCRYALTLTKVHGTDDAH